MKRRERLEKFHFILLALSSMLLIGFIFFAGLGLRKSAASRDFSIHLGNIDDLIRNGDFREAISLFDVSRNPPGSARDWISLLKRTWIAADALNDPRIFSETAVLAVRAHPKSEEISSMAVIALIDADNIRDAAGIAGQLESREYLGFKAEAFLRAGVRATEPPEGEMLLAALPGDGNPENFIKAGEMTGERGYYLDASLLYLERGLIDTAVDIFLRSDIGASWPLPAALAAYDAGDYGESARYWELLEPREKMRPRNLGLLADLQMRRHRDEDAENTYRLIIDSYPVYSSAAYLGAAFLSERRKPGSGTGFLERSSGIFPRDYDSTLALAKALVAAERNEEGLAVLDRHEYFNPEMPESALLRLLASRGSTPVRSFVGGLWELANSHPENPTIRAILGWYLLSFADHDGIRELLDREESNSRHSLSYRGIREYAAGDTVTAADMFRRQTAEFPDCPEGYYNLGLVHLARGNPAGALSAFEGAGAAMRFAEDSGLEEKNTMKIVESLILLRRFSEAHSVLKEYLENNPGHPESLRKLRKLEGISES